MNELINFNSFKRFQAQQVPGPESCVNNTTYAFAAGTCRVLVQVPEAEVVDKKYYSGHRRRVLVDSHIVREKAKTGRHACK